MTDHGGVNGDGQESDDECGIHWQVLCAQITECAAERQYAVASDGVGDSLGVEHADQP